MLIRKWTSLDNKQIEELERVCFAYPWTYEMICETQAHPLFCGFVANDSNGSVIGYVGAIYVDTQADIALVAVHPSSRRQGIAQSLINRLIEALFNSGVTEVFLEVRVTNESAKNLYLKLGFKPVGIRKNYYENTEDAIVMKKVLSVEQK